MIKGLMKPMRNPIIVTVYVVTYRLDNDQSLLSSMPPMKPSPSNPALGTLVYSHSAFLRLEPHCVRHDCICPHPKYCFEAKFTFRVV